MYDFSVLLIHLLSIANIQPFFNPATENAENMLCNIWIMWSEDFNDKQLCDIEKLSLIRFCHLLGHSNGRRINFRTFLYKTFIFYGKSPLNTYYLKQESIARKVFINIIPTIPRQITPPLPNPAVKHTPFFFYLTEIVYFWGNQNGWV